jgi:aspartate/methionine/tyrosine aminotransferase
VAAWAKALLDTNRRNLDVLLESHPGLPGVRPGIGTTVFPKLPHGNVGDFCALLQKKYETSVVPGEFFEMPQHFRIGIGGDTTMTAEALKRLGQALDEFE